MVNLKRKICFLEKKKNTRAVRILSPSTFLRTYSKAKFDKTYSIGEKAALPIPTLSQTFNLRPSYDSYHFSNSSALLTHPSLLSNNPLPLETPSLQRPTFPLSPWSPFFENSPLIASNELHSASDSFSYTHTYTKILTVEVLENDDDNQSRVLRWAPCCTNRALTLSSNFSRTRRSSKQILTFDQF